MKSTWKKEKKTRFLVISYERLYLRVVSIDRISTVYLRALTILRIRRYELIVRFLSNYRFTKPQTFADCIGNELPLGWEEAYDKHVGAYYINHVNREYPVFI